MPLVALTILFGFYPKPVLDMSAASVQQLVNNYSTAVTAVKAAAPAVPSVSSDEAVRARNPQRVELQVRFFNRQVGQRDEL